MFPRALTLALLFSAQVFAHHHPHGGSFGGNQLAVATTCAPPTTTVTMTVTAAAAAATTTSAAAASTTATTTTSAIAASTTAKAGKGGNNNGAGTGNNSGSASSGSTGSGASTGKNGGSGSSGSAGNSVTTTASAAAASSTSKTGKGGNNSGAGAGQNSGSTGSGSTGNGTANDPQTAMTLDPKVLATGFESDGQQEPTAGQVASLTSSNNFINFCLTRSDLAITNGAQVKTGSCNPAPMGMIPATTAMPSSKFTSPTNFGTIKANAAFDIKMAVSNIEMGNFVNPNTNYYAAPQQLNAQGTIIGHSHVVVEQLDSLTQTTPLDPQKFAFFKGVNTPASNGVVTVNVSEGLPEGVYRLSSINAAMNHQPVLGPIAQHGSFDDVVYFTVTADGNSAGAASGNATTTASAKGNAATTATGKGKGKGKRGDFESPLAARSFRRRLGRDH